MKISRIEVSNVGGIARADINLNTPVLLVAGANMAGKSSLRDAISMALTGEPARVSKKNQLAQIVHDGAKKGRATLLSGEEVIGQFTLPKGEFTGAGIAGAEFLPLVLDPSKLASMTSDERRSTLFKITGCSAGLAAITPMLEKRGVNMELFNEVKPMLRSGFPAAEKYAQDKAREAKGAWKATTGETWGSDKADGWEPEQQAGAVDAAALTTAKAELDRLNEELDEAQRTLGMRQLEREQADSTKERISSLAEVAELKDRRQAKLDHDTTHRDEWAGKLAEAKRAAEGHQHFDAMSCPHCAMFVRVENGHLLPAVDHSSEADPDAAKRVTEFAGYLESAERAVTNSKRDLDASVSAAAALAELQASPAASYSEEAIANAEQVINDLRQQRDHAAAKHSALADAFAAIESRAKTISTASTWHNEVTSWLAIADAMSPEGIPGDLLKQALAPVNQSLANLAAIAGWPLVEISKDIEITSAGRAYALTSESEKWRADTLLALAIAQITGLRFAVLDRFDVLEPAARAQLISLLRELAKMDSMDTIIMLGTLKEAPAKLPPEFTAAWISNCIVEA